MRAVARAGDAPQWYCMDGRRGMGEVDEVKCVYAQCSVGQRCCVVLLVLLLLLLLLTHEHAEAQAHSPLPFTASPKASIVVHINLTQLYPYPRDICAEPSPVRHAPLSSLFSRFFSPTTNIYI